jgi:hypothetical protein
MGQAPPAYHRHLAAGDLARLDVAGAQVIVEAGEPPGVHPGGVSVNLHVIPPIRDRSQTTLPLLGVSPGRAARGGIVVGEDNR